MTIEWLRDLLVIITMMVVIGVLIFITVLNYRLYREAQELLVFTKGVLKVARDMSRFVETQLAKPLIEIAAIVQGVQMGIQAINKILKKEDKKNE